MTNAGATPPGHEPGPYQRSALTYRQAGWAGVLPVIGKDRELPVARTGRTGADPDDETIATWVQQRGGDNVVLRMPDDVIGIDVDAYGDRVGELTLIEAEEELGPLPPTWRSSARPSDSVSGIRFFRVPAGVHWRGELGTHVQIIQRRHRYALVWPSVHPDLGLEYGWYESAGQLSDRVPNLEEFPNLPELWVRHLTRSRTVGGGGSEQERGEPPQVEGLSAAAVHELLVDGVPTGEQNERLFRYACSMRARRWHREEALLVIVHAISRMANDPCSTRGDWDPVRDGSELVTRVWREYPPGSEAAVLTDAERDWAQQFRDRTRAVNGSATTPTAVTTVLRNDERDVLRTDLGNTLRFVRLHRDRIRYSTDEHRWYAWDGLRWAPDTSGLAVDLTKNVIDEIRAEGITTEQGGDQLLTWAKQSEDITRRHAMVKGAQSEPELVATTRDFDADPYLLVVRNGVVDLRTGRLREPDPALMCSRLAEVEFDPDARAPRWHEHVELITNGDPVLAAYLRRAVGYTFTGDVGERAFFFLQGSGSNGKNALIEPLVAILGSYGQVATPSLITGGEEQHPTILADLHGARLVFVDETKRGRALNVERIKALTGSKTIKARLMREDFFRFPARLKLWIAGNGQPVIRDPSDGVWTRMKYIVCHGKVSEDRKVRNFGELLYVEEASGILNWALEGLRDYRQLGGLGAPESVQHDVADYRDEEDYVGAFIAECLVVDQGAHTSVEEVFARYQWWAASAGLRGQDLLNKVHLSRALRGHELHGGRVRGVRSILGVRLAGARVIE